MNGKIKVVQVGVLFLAMTLASSERIVLADDPDAEAAEHASKAGEAAQQGHLGEALKENQKAQQRVGEEPKQEAPAKSEGEGNQSSGGSDSSGGAQ